MQDWPTIIAFLTAGVSLSIGSISIISALQKQDRTDLIFGLMGLSLFVFLLLPPTGFIPADRPPYQADLLIKRIFIFAYYTLFPWFIRLYTGRKNRLIPLIITLSVIADYGIMFFTPGDAPEMPFWTIAATINFGVIALYGLTAGLSNYREDNTARASWFLAAIALYGCLSFLTIIDKMTDLSVSKQIGAELFYPIHFHAVLFMAIVGLGIAADSFDKSRLEKLVKAREKRWHSFMKYAPILVVELDKRGNIVYINDFAVDQFGHANPHDVVGKSWFELFASPSNVKAAKLLFDKSIEEGKVQPYARNAIRGSHGREMLVDWINYLTYSDEGQVLGVMSVGRDVTEASAAQRQIDQLRLELEKENIINTYHAGTSKIIGSSKALDYAIQKANQVAKTTAPVLLEGETGVGKELFADLIHAQSTRNTMPMIKVNCGALPKDLIEDELFGHDKGAFTTAVQARKGRFELADGGTIFLDEIGELPLDMQPKLLRVLQNGEFEKVGGQKTIKVNVRVIAATNRDLAHEISEGRFRDDLFYRLNVFPITIPAVRKRKEDLPELISHFILHKSRTYGKSIDQISKADLQRLMDYPWPGNVRELENVIERSVIASSGSTLKLDWFLGEINSTENASPETLEHIERNHIIKVMDSCHWKINGDKGAAEKLNMHPNTLRSKMKKLGIERPLERSSETTT